MECMLTTKGLWEHTQTTSETDRAGDSKARAAIGLYLAEQHLETFRDCTTAKPLWEALGSEQTRLLLVCSEPRARQDVCNSRMSCQLCAWRLENLL